MTGPALGGPGSTRSSQRIEPIPAAPARTSAEGLNVQAPERRPLAKSIPFGSFEYELSDPGARGGSTTTAAVSLGLLDQTSTDGCGDIIPSGWTGSMSARFGSDTVSAGDAEPSGASLEDSTRRTNSASIS
jgi:hypothetical protein